MPDLNQSKTKISKTKIVVTGGAGFIGSHIVEEGLSRGHEVWVLDNLSSGKIENLKNIEPSLNPKLHFIHGDIQDPEILDKAFAGATSVFHLAAMISVPESMKIKKKYMEVNTLGMVNVLEAAVRNQVKNFIFSSSAAVYGDNPVSPKQEDFLPEPLSPYALNKLDGEYLCDMYRRESGLNAIALRYFNVFGPRQDPASAYAAAVPIFMDRALKNQPIIIYGDGDQTRDFVYVKDIVQANFLASECHIMAHSDLKKPIFNVASGDITTVNQLVALILAITGSSSEIQYLPARSGDIKHSRGDHQKIIQHLGFQPKFNLEKGLAAMLKNLNSMQ
jgi:UDP-glucose 4-epimerase